MKKRNIDSSDIFSHCFFDKEPAYLPFTGKSSIPHPDRFNACPVHETDRVRADGTDAMQNYNTSM